MNLSCSLPPATWIADGSQPEMQVVAPSGGVLELSDGSSSLGLSDGSSNLELSD